MKFLFIGRMCAVTFLLLLVSYHVKAKTELSVTYMTVYQYKMEDTSPSTDVQLLNIDSSGKSFFFSSSLSEYLAVGNYAKQSYQVVKNFPKRGKLTYTHETAALLGYTEDLADMEWEPLSGDTTICGYPCQKATTNYHGRTWTAWYSTELPYDDGPWKLCGLPGLILKAEDALHDFCFTAVGISSKAKDEKPPHDLAEYKYFAPKDLERQIVLLFKDYPQHIKETKGRVFIVTTSDDTHLDTGSGTPCLIETH